MICTASTVHNKPFSNCRYMREHRGATVLCELNMLNSRSKLHIIERVSHAWHERSISSSASPHKKLVVLLFRTESTFLFSPSI